MIRSERGFTLVEILIALMIFAMVVVGTITVIGVATAGGFLGSLPTSFATTRLARDYTAASTYLQSFQEFVADSGYDYAPIGTFCFDGPAEGSNCLAADVFQTVFGSDAPTPEKKGYQLNWARLEVVIEEWGWDDTARAYTATGTGDTIKLVQSNLFWIYRDPTEPRSLPQPVKRFLCSADIADPADWCRP